MILVAGCSNSPGGGGEKRPASAAVVVVSGGDATSPFTTPDAACATGLAAGNTDTAIREFLLSKKYTVYTSPAMAGRGQVVDQTGFGAFGVCPVTLQVLRQAVRAAGTDAANLRVVLISVDGERDCNQYM